MPPPPPPPPHTHTHTHTNTACDDYGAHAYDNTPWLEREGLSSFFLQPPVLLCFRYTNLGAALYLFTSAPGRRLYIPITAHYCNLRVYTSCTRAFPRGVHTNLCNTKPPSYPSAYCSWYVCILIRVRISVCLRVCLHTYLHTLTWGHSTMTLYGSVLHIFRSRCIYSYLFVFGWMLL